MCHAIIGILVCKYFIVKLLVALVFSVTPVGAFCDLQANHKNPCYKNYIFLAYNWVVKYHPSSRCLSDGGEDIDSKISGSIWHVTEFIYSQKLFFLSCNRTANIYTYIYAIQLRGVYFKQFLAHFYLRWKFSFPMQ